MQIETSGPADQQNRDGREDGRSSRWSRRLPLLSTFDHSRLHGEEEDSTKDALP